MACGGDVVASAAVTAELPGEEGGREDVDRSAFVRPGPALFSSTLV